MKKVIKKHEVPLFEVIAVKKRNKMFFKDSIAVHTQKWNVWEWEEEETAPIITPAQSSPRRSSGSLYGDDYSGSGGGSTVPFPKTNSFDPDE